MAALDDHEPVAEPGPVALKSCCMCGLDVSEARRLRDSSGRYWCESCVKLEVSTRHAPEVVVCPDCGDANVPLSDHDGLRLCAPCIALRQQEIVDAAKRREARTYDPERSIRRMIHLLIVATLLFIVLMVGRYAVPLQTSSVILPLKFEGRIDDWLNLLAIACPLGAIIALVAALFARKKMRQIAYDRLIETVENGIIALAERQNQAQSVVERTEDLRTHARRAIRRIEVAAGRGIARADKLIEQFSTRHDTAPLVAFLSDQRAGSHDLVARNREIETLAYLGGDYETATSAVTAVLLRIPSELDALTRYAMILCAVGKFDEAKRIFTRVINLAERKNDDLAVADGFANLGLVHQLLGEIDDAHRYHNKALFMYKKLPGNDDREADCYGNIGFIHHKRGEATDAELCFRRALEINTRLKRVEGMALDYGVLGLMVYNKDHGPLNEAEKMIKQAVTLNDQIGRFGAVAAAYGNIGLVRAKMKDFKRARQMLLTALGIYQRLNRPKMVTKVQQMLTQINKASA